MGCGAEAEVSGTTVPGVMRGGAQGIKLGKSSGEAFEAGALLAPVNIPGQREDELHEGDVCTTASQSDHSAYQIMNGIESLTWNQIKVCKHCGCDERDR